ncbi:hypothetical protein [Hymenobacter arizonensis]|uniref:Por secretion system C-terminal sorting domain-containing protein n=1 Tax=Hymenobacter arizonensis TaxID=1227077 RepID=A0A1I5YYS4_HYMAR|nr:hypothetical protein [Hymenobacter arizonensis]SFQ49260.1 hypothetical protein SAMN04515668_2541 [Hymenobacter arizonensis]
MLRLFTLLLCFLFPLLTRAQTPTWQAALANNSTTIRGSATVLATAVGPAGQVYVAGYLSGQVGFGPIVVRADATQDAFVARWEPSTGAWAWALGAGGTSIDQATGLVVSGNRIYLTGNVNNYAVAGDANGGNNVQFGSRPLPGTGPSANGDVFVARLTDTGNPTDWDWVRQAGGINEDRARGLALSGDRLYVAGAVQNAAVAGDANGRSDVQFGSHPLPGTGPSLNYDLFVARITDAASPTDWDWALAGGGTDADEINAVAVSGSTVYLAGYTTNRAQAGDANGTADVQLGSLPLPGSGVAFNPDVLVARLNDTGPAPTWAWAVPAGGVDDDEATALAVSGGNLYVVGASVGYTRVNDPNGGYDVQFGSHPLPGLSTSPSADVFAACLRDPGNAPPADWAWVRQAGGFYDEQANGVAVRGTAVYVVGYTRNYAFLNRPDGASGVRFGATTFPGSGSAANNDSFVARLTDQGTTASDWDWALSDSGVLSGQANAVTATATDLYVGGAGSAYTTYGAADGSPIASNYLTLTIASVTDNGSSGAWQRVRTARTENGSASVTATAVGSGGQVYVAGYFSGQVRFGPWELTTQGGEDVFVARWEPGGAGAWAWVVRGGGRSDDQALALAVRGPVLYVGGKVNNNAAPGAAGGTADVRFGAHPLPGIGSGNGTDAFVARLTDAGTAAAPSWDWALQGGGTSLDQTSALAVSGNSVYVAGTAVNAAVAGDANGRENVQFGAHPLPGIGPSALRDVFLARITDAGTAPSWDWAVQGGGTSEDLVAALALRGTAVYAVGSVTNTPAAGDANGRDDVQFGSHPLPGIGGFNGTDVFVARLTDPGTTAPTDWDWALQAGGTASDQAHAVAINGNQLYVAGQVSNRAAAGDANGGNDVQFGTRPLPGTGRSTEPDAFVARLTDAGSAAPADWDWALAGGGSYADVALGLAVGNGGVYVTGYTVNQAVAGDANGAADVQFGALPSPGRGANFNGDVFLARATDPAAGAAPAWEWLLTGGGERADQANAVALSGNRLYVGALAWPAATFGTTTLPAASGVQVAVLGVVTDNTVLATRPSVESGKGAVLTLYPNPTAGGSVTVAGAAPRMAGQVLDALGRVVAGFVTDAAGSAVLALPRSLARGIYVVRAGEQRPARLVVE